MKESQEGWICKIKTFATALGSKLRNLIRTQCSAFPKLRFPLRRQASRICRTSQQLLLPPPLRHKVHSVCPQTGCTRVINPHPVVQDAEAVCGEMEEIEDACAPVSRQTAICPRQIAPMRNTLSKSKRVFSHRRTRTFTGQTHSDTHTPTIKCHILQEIISVGNSVLLGIIWKDEN